MNKKKINSPRSFRRSLARPGTGVPLFSIATAHSLALFQKEKNTHHHHHHHPSLLQTISRLQMTELSTTITLRICSRIVIHIDDRIRWKITVRTDMSILTTLITCS